MLKTKLQKSIVYQMLGLNKSAHKVTNNIHKRTTFQMGNLQEYYFVFRGDENSMMYWNVLSGRHEERNVFLQAVNVPVLEEHQVRTVGEFLDWKYHVDREVKMREKKLSIDKHIYM